MKEYTKVERFLNKLEFEKQDQGWTGGTNNTLVKRWLFKKNDYLLWVYLKNGTSEIVDVSLYINNSRPNNKLFEKVITYLDLKENLNKLPDLKIEIELIERKPKMHQLRKKLGEE